MSESALRKSLLKNTPSLMHLIPVENSLGVGTPDLNGCINGYEFWAELKYVNYPKLRKTVVKLNHYTEDQKRWLIHRWITGGNVFLILQAENDMYIFANRKITLPGTLTRGQLQQQSDFWCKRRGINWGEFFNAIELLIQNRVNIDQRMVAGTLA